MNKVMGNTKNQYALQVGRDWLYLVDHKGDELWTTKHSTLIKQIAWSGNDNPSLLIQSKDSIHLIKNENPAGHFSPLETIHEQIKFSSWTKDGAFIVVGIQDTTKMYGYRICLYDPANNMEKTSCHPLSGNQLEALQIHQEHGLLSYWDPHFKEMVLLSLDKPADEVQTFRPWNYDWSQTIDRDSRPKFTFWNNRAYLLCYSKKRAPGFGSQFSILIAIDRETRQEVGRWQLEGNPEHLEALDE
ncbi:MAG: hypothetical protein AAFU60_17495, partial [Bacteroidota bacterium]